MRSLTDQAGEIGSNLYNAAIGLEAIGNLLGADGNDHQLNGEEVSGLCHAVLALGAYIKAAGYDLSLAAEIAKAGGAQ